MGILELGGLCHQGSQKKGPEGGPFDFPTEWPRARTESLASSVPNIHKSLVEANR